VPRSGPDAGVRSGASTPGDLGLFIDSSPAASDGNARSSSPAGAAEVRSGPRRQGGTRGTITCLRGPEEGSALALGDGSFTIGRARENDLVLKDIAASRRHVRIEVDAAGVRLFDLGSGNGTLVNGLPLRSEIELRHGDRIEIGGSVLAFSGAGQAPIFEAPDGGGPKGSEESDAQDRVIRAADRLAAELSDKVRSGDRLPAGFDDLHVAKTRPQRVSVDEEAPVVASRKKPSPGLWGETFTNMPLSDVVPASEPLRGAGARPSESVTPAPIGASPRSDGYGTPRGYAPYLPEGAPTEEASVSERGEGGSFLLSLLVSALVVVIGGAALLAVFWIKDRNDQAQSAAEMRSVEYQTTMRRCEEAFTATKYEEAIDHAILALQLKPSDPIAATYLQNARKRLVEAAAPPATGPAPPTIDPGDPGDPGGTPSTTAGATTPSADEGDDDKSGASEIGKGKPRPGSRDRPKAKKISEAAAQRLFQDAVTALREERNREACRLLDRLESQATAGSGWKQKAAVLSAKSCR
jgi:pSer/pThr/pTyr-binding forkhead associated (FHA) protein